MFVCTGLRRQPRLTASICWLFSLHECLNPQARMPTQTRQNKEQQVQVGWNRNSWQSCRYLKAGLPVDRNESGCGLQRLSALSFYF